MGPRVDTATIRTVLSTNRVDLGSFSSGCCAFRRTHTSADPIRLLCIRLALPLTLPLPLRFAPSARLTVGDTPCALWLVGDFSCDCMFWENSGEGLTTQPVGTATTTTVMSANRVDLESFSSRCWTFRRTHTSADPIRVLCTRLVLPLTLCGALWNFLFTEHEGLSTLQRECLAEPFMPSILSLRIFTSRPGSRLQFFVKMQIEYSY